MSGEKEFLEKWRDAYPSTPRKLRVRTPHLPKPFTPTPMTEQERAEIFAAVNRLRIAFYQPLYLHGFASPGNGGPWKFDYELMNVYLSDDPSLKVFARTPEEMLDRVRLISDAIDAGKVRVHSAACCPLAEFRPCACDYSFRCPVHGDKCHGTHD